MIYLWIAARPRCGSHWLGSLLGSVPGCYINPEEPFHAAFMGQPRFWDGRTNPRVWLEQDATHGKRLAGWIVHHDQCWPEILEAAMPLVTHAVMLYRHDLLAQYASLRLAELANDWRTDVAKAPHAGTLTVVEADFREWAAGISDSIQADAANWREVTTLLLAYEDLHDAPRIFGDWLGIDFSVAQTATHRRESRPLWQVVANYQDARRWAAECAVEDLP